MAEEILDLAGLALLVLGTTAVATIQEVAELKIGGAIEILLKWLQKETEILISVTHKERKFL